MQADATVTAIPLQQDTQGISRAQQENMRYVQLIDFTADANLQRAPDYYVYIFNIAPRKFEVRRPPSWPLVTFAACPKGQPYALVGKIPSTVNERSTVNDREIVVGYQGERFATDLLNPTNLGTDIWREITDDQISWVDGGTDDLTRRGLFWSRNETPTADELAKATDRMERHYKALLAQGDEYFRTNRQREIGPEHLRAADHYHYKAQWHTIAEVPHTCPNCGEAVRPGIAYHMNAMNVICVLDWKRAVESGVKAKEDVPHELRWWKGPGRPPKEEVEVA